MSVSHHVQTFFPGFHKSNFPETNIKAYSYFLGSNASAPPFEPPPGVLQASRSMYSSASNGSYRKTNNNYIYRYIA